MEWITTTIGLRKSKSVQESLTSRRLQETKVEEEFNFIENLNLLLFGVAGFIILLIFAGLAFVFLRRNPKLQKKMRLKTKVIVFNAIHQTVNTASLPILHGAFKSIQSAILLGRNFATMITPLCVATAIFVYPAAVYKFLKGK